VCGKIQAKESAMNGNLFVFRPGGASGGNVFTDWQLLITAMAGVEGRKMLEFDDSLLPPPAFCEIPAGVWPMKDVMWAGFGPRPGIPRTTVHILSGAVFTNLRMIGGQITIVNKAKSPDPSPVSDFSPLRDHLQIGLRDDCGNTQFVNQYDVPMFDLKSQPALFFVQNCLFGMPTADVPNPTPLIRHTGRSSVLAINLLGQNQTGQNLVSSAAGASVLFGALSSSAQVGVVQTSITNDGGTYGFGPQGRIQRLVIPRPPELPATTSQTINTPNVLVRCNGTHPGFTQVLPGIASGFGVGGNVGVPLYTGGQELVVAEVSGGSKLKVSPSGSDTIDGDTDPVHIGKHGSRTFASDGVSNWITISEVRHAE
jgi:hypothetical protein